MPVRLPSANPSMSTVDPKAYLDECRRLVLDELPRLMPRSERYRPVLYDLMLDYPLRAGKALRPALCIAVCRALGGHLESVLPSAAVLELYHNAFLVHDDVEDGSEQRRGAATLHREHGVPIAVNVGDAMLALTLGPLLDNIELLGLGKALRILRTVSRMSLESAEGQALELDWIRHERFDLTDADYVRMVYKKTGWYTFIAPMLVGGIAAGASPERLAALRKFGAVLGVAFQIQDDILNLTAREEVYGKEIGGDLWEGKRTLILLHALRVASPVERARALAALRGARPSSTHRQGVAGLTGSECWNNGASYPAREESVGARDKATQDIQILHDLIDRAGSIPYARSIAARWADRARTLLGRADGWLEPSVHRSFVEGLIDFVVARDL